jgi:hypothetical protein
MTQVTDSRTPSTPHQRLGVRTSRVHGPSGRRRLRGPMGQHLRGFEFPSTILKLRTNYGPRPTNSGRLNGQPWTPAIEVHARQPWGPDLGVKGSRVQISPARQYFT